MGVRRILRGDCGTVLRESFPLRNDDRRRGHRLTLKKQAPGRVPGVLRLSRRAVNCWNALPANVVEEVSEERFKLLLDAHLERLWSQDHQ